ncbi:HAMP domain-containing sensor histidine kinase [Acaryochloris marina]|uniref:ATP-binding response regulator n=1 Tax=Acaryochloris marina TaxID=155978 RepID=UPI001BAEFFF3|nr:HAMP domain-containing sensor histidine kinase [Acaryochloris marina]QUY45500.1 HAMP domain-containing histidine kinase [Acaryochloris marina S15]
MARILLLFARSANSKFVSEKLSERHEVISVSSEEKHSSHELLQEFFDLCIVDGQMLEQLWQPIADFRSAQQPVLLPVLLIVGQGKVSTIKPQYWQVIEEIVTAPIEIAALQVRVETLLRTRQFSIELQQANAQLRQANEELQELNRLKSQFVSMVSHEFRNPLGAISGYIQLLEGRGNTLSTEKTQDFFQHIRDSLKRLTSLVDDVLVMGRVGVGKLTYEPEALDLELFCRRLIEEVKYSSTQSCRLEFEVKNACDTSQSLVIDQKLLRYILGNLLTNAIKYSPDGDEVQLRLAYLESQIEFQVQDSGIGIPWEDQQHLFEPFYRAANVGRLPGSGLGLAIVKQCVELHNGHIEVSSAVDQGTNMTVRLPLRTSPNG